MTPLYSISAAVLLGVTLLACRLIRSRTSAAFRHLLLTVAFAAIVVLPVLASVLSRTEPVRRLRTSVVLTVTPEAEPLLPPASAARWLPTIPLEYVWLAGTAVCMLRLAAGLLRLRTQERELAPERVARLTRIPVYLGRSIDVPHVEGILRPSILLPTAAAGWPDERLRIVLAHESIHVERRDLLSGLVAESAAALHWFNPLAWLALRELRRERELACDEVVLRRGVDSCDYADHLLAVVSGVRGGTPSGAIAMGDESHLETRIRSILNPKLPKGEITMKSKCFVAATALAVVSAMSAFHAAAQSGAAALSGTVLDATSARVADALVVVRNLDQGTREITRSDATGDWRFNYLPAGTYSVEVAKRGFQLYKQEKLQLTAGGAQDLQVILSVGKISENVEVTGKRTTPAPPQAAATPQRVRMGGSVQAAKLIHSVRPEYPPQMKAAGMQGAVLLEAVVGRDGRIANLRPLNTLVHSDLIEAAMAAVRQWQYEPTLLNGEPVEIITEVTVNFTLMP